MRNFLATKLVSKETVMFCLGATGFLHEMLGAAPERPFLLALSGALMGLPFVLSADQKLWRKEKEEDDEDEKWSHLP